MPDIRGLPVVTPSNIKPAYWVGTKAPDGLLTVEQLAACRVAEEKEGRSLTTIEVGVRFEPRSVMAVAQWIRFHVPLIVETRLAWKIITPSGHIIWHQKPKRK